MAIDRRHPISRQSRHIEVPVAAAMLRIMLQLQQQARDKVDRAAKLGNFLDMQSHAVVVLGSVETDPGH